MLKLNELKISKANCSKYSVEKLESEVKSLDRMIGKVSAELIRLGRGNESYNATLLSDCEYGKKLRRIEERKGVLVRMIERKDAWLARRY